MMFCTCSLWIPSYLSSAGLPSRPAGDGRDAIQAIYQQMVDAGVKSAIETPLPTVRFENLALTSTRSAGQHRRPRAGPAPAAR